METLKFDYICILKTIPLEIQTKFLSNSLSLFIKHDSPFVELCILIVILVGVVCTEIAVAIGVGF